MKSESVISRSVISQSAAAQPLGYARRFQDLAVYKKVRILAREVFRASKKFPREEAFSLTDQLRRASRSIGGQIAESWAKRRYPKHFISKLTDADGEQMETQHWLTEAYDCEYLSKAETHRLGSLCLEVGAMLGEMISKADQFCQPEEDRFQEAPPDYRATEAPNFLTDD
jgi:four helix bundle protein